VNAAVRSGECDPCVLVQSSVVVVSVPGGPSCYQLAIASSLSTIDQLGHGAGGGGASGTCYDFFIVNHLTSTTLATALLTDV
jgi:hypothetical protein